MKKKVMSIKSACLILLALSTIGRVGTATTPTSHWLSIRIDQQGRFWWNERRVSHENLPKPIPLFVDANLEPDDKSLPRILTDVLESYIAGYRVPNIIVVVHDETHYMHLENFLSALDEAARLRQEDLESRLADMQGQLEQAGDLEAADLRAIMREMERNGRLMPNVILALWRKRDDRILKTASDSAGIQYQVKTSVREKHQFIKRFRAGFWEERFPDTLGRDFPMPSPPTRIDLIPDSIAVGNDRGKRE